MSNDSRPAISKGTKLYGMAKKLDDHIILTMFAPTVLAVTCTLAVLRWGAPPLIIAVVALLWCPVLFGFYLYYTRSKDNVRHPFIKKFLSNDQAQEYVDRFEQEIRAGDYRRFSNALITPSFIMQELTYRYRWAHSSEIVWAYFRQPELVPALGTYKIAVHLTSGDEIEISGRDGKAAKEFFMQLTEMAPHASLGDTPELRAAWRRDRDQLIAKADERMKRLSGVDRGGRSEQLVAAELSGLTRGLAAPDTDRLSGAAPTGSAAGHSADAARIVARLERVSVLVRDKEEEYRKQIDNLKGALDQRDLTRAAVIMDLMRDTGNADAAELLIALLDSPEESLKARAALTLGKLGNRSAVDRLIAMLEDASVDARESAAEALGMIGDNRAEVPLRTVPIDNPRVKRAAIKALKQIEGQDAG